jgi:quercetin dioxygenase-like cupin family protein
MKVIKIAAALKRLKKLNEEIRYADCFADKRFTAGVIAFRPTKNCNPKQINHADKDVVCHVIKGTGRLRADGKYITLKPGTVCHIPKGTPHDFAAKRSGELVLFYSLIKTS